MFQTIGLLQHKNIFVFFIFYLSLILTLINVLVYHIFLKKYFKKNTKNKCPFVFFKVFMIKAGKSKRCTFAEIF
jgi:hypothetical protein